MTKYISKVAPATSKALSMKGKTALRRQQSHFVELSHPQTQQEGRELLLEGGAVA